MSSEVWRIVPGINHLIASSHGRIMLIPERKPMPRGGLRNYGGKPTYGQWDGCRFIDYDTRARKTRKVHRLVCAAFSGPAPRDQPVCMHLDENPRNNRPENLQWGTQKENLNAPGFLDYCRGRVGENNPFIKGRNTRRAS